jgi:L-ascorbate metabolism protein UlaG (beta-lactamase superfamily)
MKKKLFSVFMLVLIIAAACAKDNSVKCSSAPAVSLGNDTTVISNTSINLNALTRADSGRWTIISGTGGSFENASHANSQFTGTLNANYQLRWVSYNACGNNADTLSVTFKSEITAGDMVSKLHWLGQADFRIETAGKVIYIDHIKKTEDKPADIILITHSHGDHLSPAAIAKVATENTVILGPADCKYTGVCKEFITIVPGDEYALNEFIKIKAVPAYNIVKANNHPKSKKWVGYLISSEGITIYHAGDTERIPEMKEFTCDIALMPLGQTYTMASVDEAVEATKDVKAKIAIPMHYGTGEGKPSDAVDFKARLNEMIEVIIKTIE